VTLILIIWCLLNSKKRLLASLVPPNRQTITGSNTVENGVTIAGILKKGVRNQEMEMKLSPTLSHVAIIPNSQLQGNY
jgi:hypothetical protein